MALPQYVGPYCSNNVDNLSYVLYDRWRAQSKLELIRSRAPSVRPPSVQYKMATPARKQKCTGKFLNEWTAKFGGLIVRSKSGEQYARCVVCSRDVKVASSGLYDVNENMNSKLHASNLKMHEDVATVRAFFKPRTNSDAEAADAVTRAEVLFSYFIAEHNLPGATGDHFTELCRIMFPDSAIAKRFRCKRTKTTQVIKKCLAAVSTASAVEHCKTGPFSLMVDESNDKKSDKRLGMLVRYFDDGLGRSVTRLLDLPVCNLGKAEDIFGKINSTLRYRNNLLNRVELFLLAIKGPESLLLLIDSKTGSVHCFINEIITYPYACHCP